jgi:hypothetical protein
MIEIICLYLVPYMSDYICIIALAIATGLLLLTVYFTFRHFYPDQQLETEEGEDRQSEHVSAFFIGHYYHDSNGTTDTTYFCC